MDVIFKKGVKYSKNEKERLMKIFIKNKGHYLVMGGMLTSYRFHPTMNVLFTVYNLYILFINIKFTVLHVFDFAIASECMYFSLILSCVVTFTCSMYYSEDHIQAILSKLSKGIHHYSDTLDPETEHQVQKMTERMKKRKVLLLKTVEIVFISFWIGCMILFPLFAGKFLYKADLMEKYANLIEGWYFNGQAVIHGWRAYNTDGWPGWTFCLVSEYYLAVSTLFLLNGTDLTFIGFMEEFCNETEVANLTIRQAIPRARYVYKKRYGEEVKSYDDKKFGKCLEVCLNDSVKHHINNNSFFSHIRHAYSTILLFVLLTGALMLCMSGLIFASKRMNIAIKLTFFLYLVGEITHLFIFSFYGERVTVLSSDTRDAIYDPDWPDVSKVWQPYIIMIQGLTNTPLKLSAGGFMDCNYETFGNVLSSAYSYFNLLTVATDF